MSMPLICGLCSNQFPSFKMYLFCCFVISRGAIVKIFVRFVNKPLDFERCIGVREVRTKIAV